MSSSASPLARSLSLRRSAFVTALARGLGQTTLSSDQPLLVGVSGGADSTALLLGLACLATRRRAIVGPLTVVHVHHHLRGEAADLDQSLVHAHAEQLGVPFVGLHIDPGAAAGNLAANARRERYAALDQLARTRGAAVVVGHHAEDQLETLLAALSRGSGATGLRGMPFERPIDSTDPASPPLLRPMLEIRRNAIRAFCAAAGIAWRDDPGNQDPTTLRGRLRRDVLPVLEELFPGAAGRANFAARSVAAAVNVMDTMNAVNTQLLPVPPSDSESAHWNRAALAAHDIQTIGAALRRAVNERWPECSGRLGQRHVLPAAARIASPDRRPCAFRWPAGISLDVTAQMVRLSLHSVPAPSFGDPVL